MSPEKQLNEIEKLWKLVNELRAENSSLQEIIFRQQGLLDEKVIVPEAAGTHIGREPWYMKKAKLEMAFRNRAVDSEELISKKDKLIIVDGEQNAS